MITQTLEQQKSQLIEHASALIKRVKQLELELEAANKHAKQQQAKIDELQEQVKDLIIYIEAQKVIQQQGNELKDGSIVVVANPEKKSKSPISENKKKLRKK